MRKTLRDYFIPHEDNAHKPHALRTRTIIIVALAILALEFVFLLQSSVIMPRSNFFALILPDVLVEQTNEQRNSAQVETLRTSPLLEIAAQQKANDMAAKEYFAHTSPEGVTPWYWFEQAGYSFRSAGENLAVRFVDSRDVTDAWMRSPSHRANILNGNFTEVGIATARGTYKGTEAVFVVQLFGTPATPATTPSLGAAQGLEVASQPAVAPASSSTEVAGVAVSQNAVTASEPFAQSQTQPVPAVVSAPLTRSAPTIQQSATAWVREAASAPRATIHWIYFVIGGLVLLALYLKILLSRQVLHPHLLINAFLILLIIAAFVMLNETVSSGVSIG